MHLFTIIARLLSRRTARCAHRGCRRPPVIYDDPAALYCARHYLETIGKS
jgi:hypothetical protein